MRPVVKLLNALCRKLSKQISALYHVTRNSSKFEIRHIFERESKKPYRKTETQRTPTSTFPLLWPYIGDTFTCLYLEISGDNTFAAIFCCCCCCRLRKQANISREKVKNRTENMKHKKTTSTFPLLWSFIGDMVTWSLSRYIRSNYDITQHINIIFILNLKSFVNTGPEVSSLTVLYLIVCRCINLPQMP